MIHREVLEQTLADVQQIFPDAALDDIRTGTEPEEMSAEDRAAIAAALPPVGETSFARMKETARAEAWRIECAQSFLVNSGMPASEPQLRRRDDYEGIVALIEILSTEPELKARLRKLRQQRSDPSTSDSLRRTPQAASAVEVRDGSAKESQ